jgi:hypothetical protein
MTVAESITIKAIAIKTGMTDSDVATAAYTIQASTAKVKAPDVKVTKWSTADKYWVELATRESGVSYYSTTDGTDPSATNGKYYTGSLTISNVGTTTVKFIGVKTGFENSDIVTNVVTINGTL